MPHLGVFGLEFENNIVIFEISTLEKMEMSKFGAKNALFGCFVTRILKTIFINY